MKVAIITPAVHDPECLFGAERHFLGMVQAFKRHVDTDWIQVPISEARWETILQGFLDCYDLDLASYDLVVSTKSPTYMAQHPNHICWLLHQMRVFYDRFDDESAKLPPAARAERRALRHVVQRLDSLGLRRVRRIFTNGQETARRLKLYNGFDAEVLYPPVFLQGQYCAGQQHFLLPGRLHRWKRVDLAIRAMRHLSSDVPLLIAGTGEDEAEFRRLAGKDSRIQFLGFVSDAELLKLYANALAVLFVPKDEDFGYITVEAMLSHKPVIVCKDSGEPARLVENGRTGFVVDPDPVEIAGAMGLFAGNHELAREMGEHAYASAPSQSWDDAVQRLLDAASSLPAESSSSALPIPELNSLSLLVADNQVLDPPVGGGRIRIYELYRHMAMLDFDITYVGAYDWPGPAYRDQMLAPHFRECVTPLTQPHFAHDRRYQRATGGKTTIDVTIPKLLKYSPRFQRMAREYGSDAEAVIISHPWVHPYVPRRPDQKLIYDAHNCEYVVKRQILGDTAAGRKLVEEVRALEGSLCRQADLIFACSNDDAEQFVGLYGISPDKIVLVPNGVDVEGIQPASREERAWGRQEIGLPPDKPVLIFIGSGYGPNTEAAAFLVEEIAPRLPHCAVVIAGSVSDSYQASHGPRAPENVAWLGTVEASRRLSLYHAADIALNPMFSGSGTNLKMLDYFAAGLPVVSTPAGARGLELTPDDCVVCSAEQFASRIEELIHEPAACDRLAANARKLAVSRYSWSMIAADAAQAVRNVLQGALSHVS
ncbi:MAG: glycosyltransferase family 4 protein [Candidatus Korobacteraceae bacterium]|jgi:glycosyltransferase involved in cell wall biosynthesis